MGKIRFSFEEKTVVSTGLVDGLVIQVRIFDHSAIWHYHDHLALCKFSDGALVSAVEVFVVWEIGGAGAGYI